MSENQELDKDGMTEKQELAEARRARLARTHGSLEAFAVIVGGIVTLASGLCTLYEILVPPPAPKKKAPGNQD